jgi:hypothetical protein
MGTCLLLNNFTYHNSPLSVLTNANTAKVKLAKTNSSKMELTKVRGIVAYQPVDPQPAMSFKLSAPDPLNPENDEFVEVSKPDPDPRPFKIARLFEQVKQDSRVPVPMLTVT